MKRICLLALLCVLPVHARVFKVPVQPEVQEDTLLCWAAVSAMASRAFPVESTSFRPSTQQEVVFYKKANIRVAPIPGDPLPLKVVTEQTKCGLSPGKCNDSSLTSWLLGFTATKVNTMGKMLSEGHFHRDIGIRGKPIIIRWFYASPNPQVIPGTREILPSRFGSHFLLVTGYDDVKKEIRIWDPWPHRSPGQSPASERLPRGHKREKWWPLTSYANPKKDNGWTVVAQHQFDEFALRRTGVPQDTYPALVAQATIHPVTGNAPAVCDERAKARDVDFRSGPPAVRQVADDHIRKLVVRDENDEPRQARLDPAGDAIPIVAFGSNDLWRARASPQTLLKSKTSALVVPVMEHGYLVDSFLLLYEGGQWKEGGYSNNEIARLLVELRDSPAFRNRKSELYLVSIPEEGTFFAAHGFEGDARLLSLANDARGEFVPARELLEPVLRQIARSRQSGINTLKNVADDLETR